MIRLDVNVNNAAALLATSAYGAGALLRWERAAAEAGAYAEQGTVALVSGTDQYTIWDATGSSSSWYRTRVSNAGNTVQSAYSDPFRATALLAYASVDDLIELLPQTTGTRNLNTLADCLVRAAGVIDARCERDFYRHPQVSGSETRLFDVHVEASRLVVPEGIVSVDTLEYATKTGGAYTTLAASSYFLRPLVPRPGDTRYFIDVSPEVTGHFYAGLATARVAGAFGFARPPEIIRSGSLALARAIYAETLTPSGSPTQDWESPSARLPTETYTAIEWGRRRGRAVRGIHSVQLSSGWA